MFIFEPLKVRLWVLGFNFSTPLMTTLVMCMLFHVPMRFIILITGPRHAACTLGLATASAATSRGTGAGCQISYAGTPNGPHTSGGATPLFRTPNLQTAAVCIGKGTSSEG